MRSQTDTLMREGRFDDLENEESNYEDVQFGISENISTKIRKHKARKVPGRDTIINKIIKELLRKRVIATTNIANRILQHDGNMPM